ncbi:phosphatidyl inositol kinase [Dinochytrium kinnereticum]|nr:phosphatidyl inositol kinase [Dinochytrium kinnereticum]
MSSFAQAGKSILDSISSTMASTAASVAKAASTASSSSGVGGSPSLRKKQKRKKPSRATYTALSSNPFTGASTGAAANSGVGYSLDQVNGGGGQSGSHHDEYFSDDDGEDDLESLASSVRSDDRLFSPIGAGVGSLGGGSSGPHNLSKPPTTLLDGGYYYNPSSSDQARLLQTTSPVLAPSLLPDNVLPQEPVFHGIGALSDSVHPLSSEFCNPTPKITPVSSQHFLAIVEDVRAAISEGIYPTRIAKGSSGSYFCRNRAGDIVGVFKPKNEEPYGKMNPKWTKWIHRNLFPCCFGRSCLIPNLGYLSEAAASYMDRRLGLNVVPRTEVVALASPSFFYSSKERWEYRRGKPLPPKLGSFQLFLKGFKDATTFFREGYDKLIDTSVQDTGRSVGGRPGHAHPPPLTPNSSAVSISSTAHPYNWSERTQREFQWGFERLVVLDYLIRNTDRGMDNWMIRFVSNPEASDGGVAAGSIGSAIGLNGGDAPTLTMSSSSSSTSLSSSGLKQRGAGSNGPSSLPLYLTGNVAGTALANASDDAATGTSGVSSGSAVSSPKLERASPMRGSNASPLMRSDKIPLTASPPISASVVASPVSRLVSPLRAAAPSNSVLSSRPASPSPPPPPPTMHVPPPVTSVPAPSEGSTIYVAAIDNGLAFPYKHPDRWRTYPYGWSLLPISRIPFSASTRKQILHFLTSPTWWTETLEGLERVFRIDPDFDDTMWRRQRSVIRGEGYNLAEVLRRAEMGDPENGSPASLVRRPVVCVYEEEVVVFGDEEEGEVDGVARRLRRVRQRFETFTRNQPCFKNW